MNILVAEDEPITRASLVRQLERWGHTLTVCADGEEAWSRFRESEPDLVLTDWEMPRLSGVELIQRIRAAREARFVYIVMLTGRTDKADLVRGIEAGADDFVAKPFDREELRVRLLAGERIVTLERTLLRRNAELQEASERMRYDLRAAARVQRSLLPSANITADGASAAWGYVPTEELAGDAIGLHLIDDRYLVAYLLDVSGHGVPAALLSFTAMHALAPLPVETSLLREMGACGALGTVRCPANIATELNRRFRSGQNDGRYFTLVLCVLDMREGLLHFTKAGHFLPLVIRGGTAVPLGDAGGLPIGVLDDSQYHDVVLQLEPADRVCLFSDGFIEEIAPGGSEQFGMRRLTSVLERSHRGPADQAVKAAFDALSEWSGHASFSDDVSLVLIDWVGGCPARASNS